MELTTAAFGAESQLTGRVKTNRALLHVRNRQACEIAPEAEVLPISGLLYSTTISLYVTWAAILHSTTNQTQAAHQYNAINHMHLPEPDAKQRQPHMTHAIAPRAWSLVEAETTQTPLAPLSSCIPITTSGASGWSFFARSVLLRVSPSSIAVPPVPCAFDLSCCVRHTNAASQRPTPSYVLLAFGGLLGLHVQVVLLVRCVLVIRHVGGVDAVVRAQLFAARGEGAEGPWSAQSCRGQRTAGEARPYRTVGRETAVEGQKL